MTMWLLISISVRSVNKSKGKQTYMYWQPLIPHAYVTGVQRKQQDTCGFVFVNLYVSESKIYYMYQTIYHYYT